MLEFYSYECPGQAISTWEFFSVRGISPSIRFHIAHHITKTRFDDSFTGFDRRN